MESFSDLEPQVLEVLEPDEQLRLRAQTGEAILAVTDRRLLVAAPGRIALALPFDGLRRIQFDIERDRPATMVIVPEMAHHEPQVLAIPPDQFRAAADALVTIGQQLAQRRESDRAS
jgi:hypothetical protein